MPKAPTTNMANPAVAAHLNACPKAMQTRLLKLRELILDVANGMPEVGPLEETLKWGQPAYLTSATGSVSLIRVDQSRPCLAATRWSFIVKPRSSIPSKKCIATNSSLRRTVRLCLMNMM
jgi:hypothetical protein